MLRILDKSDLLVVLVVVLKQKVIMNNRIDDKYTVQHYWLAF